MNDGQLNNYFDDLKQFISGVVSQSEARLTARIDAVEQKMDDGFAGIADIMEIQNDRLDTHDQRLVALEQPVA